VNVSAAGIDELRLVPTSIHTVQIHTLPMPSAPVGPGLGLTDDLWSVV